MIFAKSAIVNGNTVIAMTVTTNQKDGADPLAAARKRVDQALGQGYEKMQAAHQKFWAGFWATSAINIPDQAALKHYYLTRYYFGASSRPGFPAMAALESVWTDDMMFPSFKNDLHNDLETQVQYQSYQTAGNFAEGEVFFEYLWNLLPTFRTYARSFYETGGAAVPGVMTYGGNPTTGWPQYCMSPTMAGWLGWLFYEHWRYTQDEKFLKERAYPWCVEIAECWSGLLKRDEKGILKLPLSASSEVFDNSPRAWLKPNCNYDLDMMQAHLFGTVEMARALGKPDEAQRWEKMATSLGPRHVDEENALMWSENEKVTFLHRHLSHSMSIQPFNLLTVEGSDEDRKIVAATSKRYDQCFAQGGDWAGWSYPWMSSWRSRIGQAENAYMYLDMFLKAFITRNGFHMNTSMNKAVKGGHGWLFTIEANILATQAVHDMLIQSWAPSIGKGEAGIIRLFPATAWSWHEASFKDLRAEGGFKVSAKRVNNATVWFQVTATANGLLRIRDNFGGRALHWKNRVMKKSGPNYELELKKGESTEATLDVPDAMPPKPADVYTPLAPSE
jgi:alpha-L-fucosidase 2